MWLLNRLYLIQFGIKREKPTVESEQIVLATINKNRLFQAQIVFIKRNCNPIKRLNESGFGEFWNLQNLTITINELFKILR